MSRRFHAPRRTVVEKYIFGCGRVSTTTRVFSPSVVLPQISEPQRRMVGPSNHNRRHSRRRRPEKVFEVLNLTTGDRGVFDFFQSQSVPPTIFILLPRQQAKRICMACMITSPRLLCSGRVRTHARFQPGLGRPGLNGQQQQD